ncbi:alpha/beta-hydrolase [Trametes cingulata]|nr:alpha/beta-hydrolase [Trametes cingulata]
MPTNNRSCSRLLSFLTAVLGLGTSYASSSVIVEGSIPFAHGGETYQTFYKVFGNLTTRTHTPLVVLHGGPGLSHDYLLPLSDLSTHHAIPVILYDQIGNARSTHLRDKPASFFTIDLFIDELENLLAHLSVENSFDLFGHSWGGILGTEFEVRRRPAGLRHLILSDSLASMELWQESNAQLLKAFPKDVQEGMAAGMKDPAAYQNALRRFHAVHGCRVKPMPKEFVFSIDQVFGSNGDPTVASSS